MNNPSIYEVLQFAVGMEEEGEKFYRFHAASYTGDIRNVFLKLASDEVEHARYFRGLYQQLDEQSSNDYLFDLDVVSYSREYAKSSTFNRQVKALNLIEAIEEGIKTEKSTVDFYENLVKYATEETKSMLDRMIAEEKKHVMILQDILDQNI